MINQTELRIGNYIYDDENVIVKVERIDSKRYNDWNGEGNPPVLFSINGSIYESDIINSIPLTEEILLKCGFKYENGEYVRGLWKLLPDFPKEEVIGYGLFIKGLEWRRINQNSIKYVHQLQNLFFTITGYELGVKFE